MSIPLSSVLRAAAMHFLTQAVALCPLCVLAQPRALSGNLGLEKGFLNPPDSARPWVYWFWLNQNITREGITADLEAMARVGIGGALIMDIRQGGLPDGKVLFMTPEWRALFKHAVSEAARLGLQITMNVGPGWSGSGGSWITPGQGMKTLTWSQTRLKGGGPVKAQLPQPPSFLDYYRDVAVIAFSEPASESATIQALAPKVTCSAPDVALEKVTDGDPMTSVRLPLPTPEKPQFIQFEFAEPFVAHALTLVAPSYLEGLTRAELQVSDDGKDFRTVCPLELRLRCRPVPRCCTVTFPETRVRYYRIVLLAASPRVKHLEIREIELTDGARVPLWEGKAGFASQPGHGGGSAILTPSLSHASPSATVPKAARTTGAIRQTDILNLTDNMDAKGQLTWNAPPGRWIVLRLGHTPTGARTAPAMPGSQGLEADKFDPQCIKAAFDGLLAKLIQDVGPLAGKTLASTHTDSWEMGQQTWTAAFREEFRKRRGYDMTPWLPVMAGGRVVNDTAQSERFLWDLRRTYADLLADYCHGSLARVAREHGIGYQAEASGAQQFMYDPVFLQSKNELPMGEFWFGSPQPRVDCKVAASVAHIYDKVLAGAESYTAGPQAGDWKNDPYRLKSLGDLAFCMGVNRFVFHRYAHQPWLDRLPGMTMGQWGSHFERTNTWWEQGAAWMKYVTRCQWLLQQGQFVGDVAVLVGEGAPCYLGYREELTPPLPEGYDYDGVDAATVLTRMAVKDGRLTLPNGMTYRALLLPDSDAMTPEMALKVRELVQAGAVIVGPRPTHSPSLAGYPACDEEVTSIARAVWGEDDGTTAVARACGRGRAFWGKSWEAIFAELKAPPDFSYRARPENAVVKYIHRRVGDADVYFVCNQEDAVVEVTCEFRVSGKVPDVWDAVTGVIRKTAVYQERDGRTIVPVRFDPVGSFFVVFRIGEPKASVVSASKDGKEIVSASLANTDSRAPTVPLKALYPEVKDTFSIAAWVKPSAVIELPEEKAAGIALEKEQCFLVTPEQGELAFGAGHAGVGLSVGVNGVAVFEHSARFRAATLVAPMDSKSWTHLAVVYEKNQAPKLYVNGQLARQGLSSAWIKHPSSQAGRGVVAYKGVASDLRIEARALSQGQLAEIMAAHSPRDAASGDGPFALELVRSGDKAWRALCFANGRYEIKISDGKTVALKAEQIPPSFELEGPWQLRFAKGWGAPETVTFEKLISWTDHANEGIRYFSGTCAYHKEVEIPEAMFGADKVIVLDLGRVKNLAEVRINGMDLGVLWKPPFRVEATSALKPGHNQMEIRVTNMWPNRLIGDRNMPENERKTWVTWSPYTKDSPLLESGLLGPVMLRSAQRTYVR